MHKSCTGFGLKFTYRFVLILFVVLSLQIVAVDAQLIAYDPFFNANVGNGENDKTGGEYNAGSFFRDFTNGNNADVAGGPIIGFNAVNIWTGNSINTGTSQYIGPTDLSGLTFATNIVQGGGVRARGYNATGDLSFARRLLDSYTTANTYYMSALVRADNLTDNLNIAAMTGFTVTISSGTFDGSSSFSGVIFGFLGDGSKVDLVVRHRDDNSVMVNSVLLEDAQQDEVYFIVVKIEYNIYSGFERLTAWLNPTSATESASSASLVTTGSILSTPDQITHAGFWIENFTSSLTDYVQFDELRFGTQWLDAVAVAPVQTVSEMAVSNYVRPDYAPKESDVCFSSRWLRGEGYQENVKWWGTLDTSEERPMDSFEAMKMYHATRLEWIYLYGDEVNQFIPKVRGEGLSVAFAQTNNLKDEPGGVGNSLLGKIVAKDGNYYKNSFGNLMGCANNEIFKHIFLREAKSRIDTGADSIQIDDPVLNDDVVCWCDYCKGTKDGFESTTEFYQWLHAELDAYYYQQYGISKFPVHGNNSSHTVYSDSYFGVEDDYRLDYGCCEINIQDVSAQHFHNIGHDMRIYQDVSRAQIITSPGTWGYEVPVYMADFTKVVRRSIGTCYAQGINMLAPFDRFGTDIVDGDDENQTSRFFGNPQNFADMFGFIRGIAIYLDGYEFTWDWGDTPKAIYHVADTPYGDTWGTIPASDQPVVSVDDGIAVVVRAKPGENDEPVAVHLVDWSKNGSFTLVLNNEKYFGEYTDNLRLTLLEPLDNYNAEDYAVTWENLNYTYYVQTAVLNGSYAAGQTTVTVPQLNPWAVLIVSKGKNDELPLYDSSRWQQLKDTAPATATPSYPLNNNLVTPIQSIMLSFDKDLDASTIIPANLIVTHEQSGNEIFGTWGKLGNLVRFSPSGVYPKGTISVELTTNLKRTNGTPCLRQKFYYDCNLKIADLNNDFSVDILDLSDIAAGWLRYTSTGDVTTNGYVDHADINVFADNWLNCYAEKPTPLYPADGMNSVSCGTNLKWTHTADSYQIYFGTDASVVENAEIDSLVFMQLAVDNFYAPQQLLINTTYYWRIDLVKGDCIVKGQVYSFTTTSKNTVGYWELDTDGSSAVGSYSCRPELGDVSSDTSNFVNITNPDMTTLWNSESNSSDNVSSLYFDGQTALVNNVPASPFQFRRSVPFTCEAYIQPTVFNPVNGIIFGTRDGFSGYTGWSLKYDSTNQRLSFGLQHPGGSSYAYIASGIIGLGQFKHVALVWDPAVGKNGQLRGYVDSLLVMEADGKDYWDDSAVCGWNLMIGGRNLEDNPWGFKGQIDEIRWSNYALNPSEFLNASN